MSSTTGYVRVHRSIKLDDDFLALSIQANWLYKELLLDVNFVGVDMWHPSKLLDRAGNATVQTIEVAAQELVDALFLVIDERTGEFLIRTFMRHDGLYQQPNMCKAMVKAYMNTGSRKLRRVIAWELIDIHERTQGKSKTGGVSKLVPASDACWSILEEIMDNPAQSAAELLAESRVDEHVF
jgi:hypothetical protein